MTVQTAPVDLGPYLTQLHSSWPGACAKSRPGQGAISTTRASFYGQSLARLLGATSAALFLTGCSLAIPQNPFAQRTCTVPAYPTDIPGTSIHFDPYAETHQVPATCTKVGLTESDSGWILKVKRSTEIDVPMRDWFNGDIDNIRDTNTQVLAPADAGTEKAINGNWGGADTILRFQAATRGGSDILEENHNQNESFAVVVDVS